VEVRVSRRDAFSLVELLVVGVIVGLLVGLLLPALTRAREQARAAVCAGGLRQIGQAAFVYYDEQGALPAEDYPGYLLWNGSDYVLYGRLLRGTGRRLARTFYCPSGREFGPFDWDTGLANLGVPGQITAGSYYTRSLSQGGPTGLSSQQQALLGDWFDGAAASFNHRMGLNVLYSDGAVRFWVAESEWRVGESNAWFVLDGNSVVVGP